MSAASPRPVSIQLLSGVREQNLARAIFDQVWPSDEGTQITANLLQALLHNGTYLSGAFIDGEIVAAAFAFPGIDKSGHLHLHSHMAAVREGFRDRGIGSAVKWHQRDWALARGYQTIAWTFDPLVRRNAKLNLIKLGVQVFDYFPDFYGDLPDALNFGDPTDRVIARWELKAPQVEQARAGKLFFEPESFPIALANVEGLPEERAVDSKEKSLLCYLPAEIVELRSQDLAKARSWRFALRRQLQPRLDAGWSISGFTQDGAYIVSREN